MRRKSVAALLGIGLLAGGATTFHRDSSSRVFAALPAPPREIPVGTRLPPLVLTDDRGQAVPLSSLRGAPTVLLFFRAASCPSCRAQLTAFAAAAAKFRAAGVEVVASSPDSPETLADARERLHLPMRLLSDTDEQAVSLLCGGLAHCELLADARGVIRWGAFSETWSRVPPPETLAEAARQLPPAGSRTTVLARAQQAP